VKQYACRTTRWQQGATLLSDLRLAALDCPIAETIPDSQHLKLPKCKKGGVGIKSQVSYELRPSHSTNVDALEVKKPFLAGNCKDPEKSNEPGPWRPREYKYLLTKLV
jgi:hypothetical protein